MKIVATSIPKTLEEFQLALDAAWAGGQALGKALAAPEQPAIKQGWDVDTLLDKPKQPAQQEPVEWVPIRQWRWNNGAGVWEGRLMHPRPQAREWVGLTDVERASVQYEAHKQGLTPLEFMELHESKLREKNT